MNKLYWLPLFVLILLVNNQVSAQKSSSLKKIDVGTSRIDITPYGPIRISGYLRMGARINESEGVLQPLWAKAIAFGSDAEGPSVLITVDLAGIPAHITKMVAGYLAKNAGIKPSQLAISASHTHSGPDMGNSHNMYSEPLLPVDQLARIASYLDSLTPKLQKVAMEALKNRRPSLISWGQGKVDFARNRRLIKDGKWIGWNGKAKITDGPVDHTLPVMAVTDPDGKLTAIFTSYACHCTTLLWDINKMHGDWIGEAQRLIEANHPGITALVAVGCGADSDPAERGTLELATKHGKSVADEVDRLLATTLQPINKAPVGTLKKIQLPFDHIPDTKELIETLKYIGAKGPEADKNFERAKGHNAEVDLERVVRGIPLDTSLTYPVQSWVFGDKLAMVFLGGEVLVDYSLRLRKELGTERLWINAYSNDVKAYIPSRRVIREGGYEVYGNMYLYDHPAHFSESIEELVVKAVHDVLPASYKPKKLNAISKNNKKDKK